MPRKETTKLLSRMLEEHIDPNNSPMVYWAKEVTFDYLSKDTVRVDYMLFKPVNNKISGLEKGDFYCYEVKSSVADFRSKNGHNFIGDYNYYVMPLEVYEAVAGEIPHNIGVYVLVPGADFLQTAVNATRMNKVKSLPEMLFMMWRSSRRDEVYRRERENSKWSFWELKQIAYDEQNGSTDEYQCLTCGKPALRDELGKQVLTKICPYCGFTMREPPFVQKRREETGR